MRVHVAVCDDEETQALYLKKLVKRWQADAMITAYRSAEAFLFAYEETRQVDILLLDIQMGKMDGIALARELRRLDGRQGLQIVFITGHPDFWAEGYEVNALHYLMKPVEEEKLREVLNRALENLRRQEKTVLLPVDGGMLRLPVEKIQSVEACAHTTAVWTEDGVFQTNIPISEMEKRLGDGCIRCHRSYLVGLRYVSRITKTDVELEDGRRIPLSRRMYGNVNQAFIRFYKGE